MGRKRKTTEDKDQMPNEKVIEPERVEMIFDSVNPLLDKVNPLFEIVNPLHPLERVNPLVEKVNSESSKQANTMKLHSQAKKAKYQSASVRRSARVNNSIVTAQNQDMELVAEELIVDESQKEDEQVDAEKQLPRVTESEKDPLTEKANPLVEQVNLEPTEKAITTKFVSQMKKAKYQLAPVRRSARINNSTVTAQNQDLELMAEELIFDEKQKEDEQVDVEKELPSSTEGEKIMEEKMDRISQLLEEQGKSIEAILSKEPRKNSSSDSRNMGYKGLYINSQKKVEALKKENHELLLKLETALAKLKGYEQGTRVSIECMQSLREITLIANMARSTEMDICNAVSPRPRGRGRGRGRNARERN